MEYAGWHPDPSGRHEFRYWDGWAWTDSVADRSLVSVDPLVATTGLQPFGAAPTTTARLPQRGAPTWVVVLALLLFFPIGLVLVWRKPWNEGAKIGITLAVAILAFGGAAGSATMISEQSKTATTPATVERPAPRTTPTTVVPSGAAARTQRFLHAAHDKRAGQLATEDDASLLALGRTGCRVLNDGLPAKLMASSLHTQTPGVTIANATYFVASIPLLCAR